MKSKRLLPGITMFLPLFILFSFHVNAQNRVITGKITNSIEGTSLARATVAVKGTRLATFTADDGSFRLSVPASASRLVISAIGFETREVDITNTSEVNVSLT